MNRSKSQQRSGISYRSTESDSVKALNTKKCKSSKFGDVIRKIFGRKNIKSQISLPTPTTQLGNDPTEFITSATSATPATDPRYQRAVSLPIGNISRHSALGSHAPLADLSTDQGSVGLQDEAGKRPRRPRRATLPNLTGTNPDILADNNYQENPASFVDGNDTVDTSNIGFAVTSGSNPKRRSRSADAFYDAKAHRMSPIQWRQHRRRSDEIRYWRDSVSPMPTLDLAAQEDTATHQEEIVADVPENNDKEEADGEAELHEQDPRSTFDFGMLATSLREQEDATIPERVATMEVKLMDLEYAISKLQTNTPSGTGQSPRHLQPPAQDSKDASDSHLHTPSKGRISPISATKSQPGSDSTTTTTSLSTQPTTASLRPTIPPSTQPPDSPLLGQKQRPTSTATTVRPTAEEPASHSPTFFERTKGMRESHKRNSITSIGIDQFTSLILLIRQEQEARRRLEAEVLQLRNELATLRSPYSPTNGSYHNGSSLYRNRPWLSERSEDEGEYRGGKGGGSGRGVRRVESYDDTSGTEDGYQDVYETPVEQRRAYEGGFFHGVEGEAF